MKKIDYAIGASASFIQHLHRNGFDRGMVATFGSHFRIEQHFTPNSAQLFAALRRLKPNGGTRLYDSIEDIIGQFWLYGDQRRPWLLIVITDGQDNESKKYKSNPVGIGRYVAKNYNQESNFITVIGVGKGDQIDGKSLVTFGNTGGFPAIAIDAFPLLEEVFLRIALQVSTSLVGRRIDIGRLSWAEVAKYYQISQIPIDYAFLIDCSGSMTDVG